MTDSKEPRPHISINAQYIKDLSFENPGAPASLTMASAPEVKLSTLNVNITKMPEDNVFEVALHIEASANENGKPLFVVELLYAGIFTLIYSLSCNDFPIRA